MPTTNSKKSFNQPTGEVAYLYEGNNFVDTGDGNDGVIEESTGSPDEVDLIFTGAGDDLFNIKGGGATFLYAGADNDRGMISGGINFVDLGTGADILALNNGIFYVDLGRDQDSDQIHLFGGGMDAHLSNFDVQNDSLKITRIDSFDEFKNNAEQVGENVVYRYGGDTITLYDVDMSTLTESNFMF